MKSEHTVGKLRVGVEVRELTGPWYVYVKSKKETVRFPLPGETQDTAKALASVLAGIIREGVE